MRQVRRLACSFLASAIVLFGASAQAAEGGTARVFHYGPQSDPGIEARAGAYMAPSKVDRGTSTSDVAGIRYEGGPRLVPLVGQVFCGHDPTIPGGLTCVLPPPERPRIANAPKRRPPRPDEVARRLADRAISLAPKPRLRFVPARRGLTGLPSYFWLENRPRPIEARAGVGGITVTAQARPVQYVWDFGDGTDRATRGPGRRWTMKRPGNIRHTYEGKGRYTVEVEVIWEARWRLGTGAWRHLGYFSNSSTRSYRVRSIVAVLVKPR